MDLVHAYMQVRGLHMCAVRTLYALAKHILCLTQAQGRGNSVTCMSTYMTSFYIQWIPIEMLCHGVSVTQ